MTSRRALRVSLLILVLAGVGVMFIRVIWIPLYRDKETARFVETQQEPAVQVDVVHDDGKATRSWTIADQQAISRLRSGLQTAQTAQGEPPASSDEKYRLRIRRSDSRVDEYEVVLGAEGRLQDRLYVIRRNGGSSVYGTVFNTPELRSALQQVLVPAAAPK
ncbi:MAG TPA: hypothetical protein VE981_11495 [Planctomycetota bacterium]|nr:hypothetical protein [Planctomycetota bacterium]